MHAVDPTAEPPPITRQCRHSVRDSVVSFDFCALLMIRANCLLARPTRFERVTFAFGGQGSLKVVRPVRNVGDQLARCASGSRTAACFFTLGSPNLRSRFTDLAKPETAAAIFSIDGSDHRFDRGSNGRWLPKICSMTLVWTLDVPDVGAGCMFSIEDGIWDGQRASASDTVGRMLVQSQGAPDGFAHAELGFGMTSKRHLFKSTFGLEMYLMLSRVLANH
jgi:hypothetical protein